jgi:hypothetical protein
MNGRVTGKVAGLGQYYANGLERIEVWIRKGDARPLPYEEGKRVSIELIIGSRRYCAGLRATRRNPYVWVCPNLEDEHEERTNLAEVFAQFDIKKNEVVVLDATGSIIHLRTEH